MSCGSQRVLFIPSDAPVHRVCEDSELVMMSAEPSRWSHATNITEYIYTRTNATAPATILIMAALSLRVLTFAVRYCQSLFSDPFHVQSGTENKINKSRSTNVQYILVVALFFFFFSSAPGFHILHARQYPTSPRIVCRACGNHPRTSGDWRVM